MAKQPKCRMCKKPFDRTFTVEFLKECFEYNDETGELFRKARPLNHFKNYRVFRWCNSRFAGKIAGTLNDGYICIHLDGVRLYAHRVIWKIRYDVWPNQIDHIDGDRSNNRIENLRNVTSAQNGKNKEIQSNNKSGEIGVCWCNTRRKWRATINVDRKYINVGYFENFNEAVDARRDAEVEHGFHPNHGRPKNV